MANSIVREAGLLERFHISLSQLGFDSCVVIAAQYNANDAVLNRQTLYPALHQVVRAHAALSVQISTGSKRKAKPRYVQLPAVNLDEIVSFADGPDDTDLVPQTITAQLARGFELDIASPLWRLTVLSERTVVFAFHHVIGDGQSGPAFHAALLAALNTPSDSPASLGNTVEISKQSQLVAPVESLADVSVSFGGFFSAIFGLFVPQFMTKGAFAWTGNPIMRTPTVITTVRCWEIETSKAAELLALCRQHDTTLTGCLHTLAAGVLARLISSNPELQRKRFKTLCAQVPVSLRRYTGTSPYSMCDQVSIVRVYTPLRTLANQGASDPWPAAAKFSKQLHAVLDKSCEDIGTIRYLYLFGVSKSWFLDALGKKRHDSFKLVNLGRFPTPATEGPEGPWSIGSVYWAQCDAVLGGAVSLNAVGSPSGAVSVTFSWAPGAIEEDFVEAFIRNVKAALSSVLDPSISS